jgi:hypothetical protein
MQNSPTMTSELSSPIPVLNNIVILLGCLVIIQFNRFLLRYYQSLINTNNNNNHPTTKQPFPTNNNNNNNLILLSYPQLISICSTIAQIGLWLCLSISLFWYGESVTFVSCESDRNKIPLNFAPSISACIGDFPLQRYIWGLTISFITFPRLFAAWIFFVTFKQQKHLALRTNTCIHYLRLIFHIGEQFSLASLTIVPSRENLPMHRIFFTMFWILFTLNGIISTFIINRNALSIAESTSTIIQKKLALSYKWRSWCISTNILASLSALFWYYKHNTECGNYHYSLFGLSEWYIVITNIFFHLIEVIDTINYLNIISDHSDHHHHGAMMTNVEVII